MILAVKRNSSFFGILVALLVPITAAGCGGSRADVAISRAAPAGSTAGVSTTTVPTHFETTTTVAATGPATTWPPQPAPRTMFVARADGIFEVSVATGRKLRRLTAIPPGYSPAWVKADRKHGRVFFGLESCDPAPEGTWVVPLAGGRPKFVTDGDEVSFSPNGRLIAFPRIEDGCAAGALVVRDLVTGVERVWHPANGDIRSVAWAPDNRHVAFSNGLPDPDVRVVDTAVPEPACQYSSAEPVLVNGGRLIDASVVGSQWILLVVAPCPSEAAQGNQCVPTVRLIDGSDGRVLTTLPALSGWHPAALDDTGRAVLLSSDTTAVLARYGLRSEATIAWAVAGDW
jgi:hypothetical protein